MRDCDWVSYHCLYYHPKPVEQYLMHELDEYMIHQCFTCKKHESTYIYDGLKKCMQKGYTCFYAICLLAHSSNWFNYTTEVTMLKVPLNINKTY